MIRGNIVVFLLFVFVVGVVLGFFWFFVGVFVVVVIIF